MSRPSMHDVAERAGVSQSTVSRVLNNTQSAIPIGEATKARVLKAADELGYVPNPLASGLRGGNTRLLGLIVREISDPFFATLIDAITELVKERGYNIVLGHARSSSDEALAVSDILDTRQCEGLFVLGDVPDNEAFIARVAESGSKAVAYCGGEPPEGIAFVDVDNEAGIGLALDYLIGLGHKRIGFIEGGWICATRQRLAAYHTHMAENGLRVHPADVVRVRENNPAGGYEGMLQILSVAGPPTAVLASDDAVAIGALKATADKGIRIPQDLSIVGFDDIEAAQFTIPALTTIRQPVDALAREGVNVLRGLLHEETARAGSPIILVRPELIIRDSAAPPGSLVALSASNSDA